MKWVKVKDTGAWPVDAAGDLNWELRHGQAPLTRSQRVCAASVLSAYRELISMPLRRRQSVIAAIRAMPLDGPKPTPEE